MKGNGELRKENVERGVMKLESCEVKLESGELKLESFEVKRENGGLILEIGEVHCWGGSGE